MNQNEKPAVELPNGTKGWFTDGNKLHSTTGPAVEHADGSVSWFVNDCPMTFEEWIKHCSLSQQEITVLQLKYAVNKKHSQNN